MDFHLTPLEQAVLDDATRVAPVLAERATEADRQRRFPKEDLGDLKEAGLMALAVPGRLGGRGAPVTAYVLAAETIAGADASLAIAWVMHIACGHEIAHAMKPGIREETLRAVVQDGDFICIAGAEGRGADGKPVPLKVSPDAGAWRLDGRKGFASGCEAARWVLTGGPDPGGTYHSFLVPMDAPGLSVSDCWDGAGMRASASHGLTFDGVTLPEDLRLTGSHRTGDFRHTSSLFGLGLAATAVGIGQAALDFALAWNRERELTDSARNRLGDAAIRLEAARAVVWRAAWTADHRPEAADSWVDRAKPLATETAHHVADEMMRLCGGSAYRTRYPLERHVRDSQALLLQGRRPDQLRVALADALLSGAPGQAAGPDPCCG